MNEDQTVLLVLRFRSVIFLANVEIQRRRLTTFDLSQPLEAQNLPSAPRYGDWWGAGWINLSSVTCAAVNDRLRICKKIGFLLVLECLEYPGEYSSVRRTFTVVLKYLCCDSSKVKARISHLLFKYLISEWSVSAPTSFRRRESEGFSREEEGRRGNISDALLFRNTAACLFVFELQPAGRQLQRRLSQFYSNWIFSGSSFCLTH